VERKWVLVPVLLLTAVAVVVAQPERLAPHPWDVSYPSWSGNFFLEPGGRVTVEINVTFFEPGAYSAFFKLYAYKEEGVVAGIPVVATLLGTAELPPDVYSGTVTLTIEATVPEDVACGAPLIVTGFVSGYSERSYAVVNGKEEPFVAQYMFDLAPACAVTMQDALETYRKLGGKEGVAALNAQLDSLRKEADSLRKEVERLQGEKTRLERALSSTQAELERVVAERAALKERLSAAEGEIARLSATVAQLGQQLEGAARESLIFKLSTIALAALLGATLVYAKRKK